MNRLLFIVIIAFSVSCSNAPGKQETGETDTLPKEETAVPIVTAPTNDSVKIIDSIVNTIDSEINARHLIKKTETQKDPEGGAVYGYFKRDKTIVYLYSSMDGEFGRDETTTYFYDGKVIYSEFRYFWFDRNMHGATKNERLVAEKAYYQPGETAAWDTITFFTDTIRPPFKHLRYTQEDLPTDNQTIGKILRMQQNLLKYGK